MKSKALVSVLTATLALASVSTVRAHVELAATLDPSQEVPTPIALFTATLDSVQETPSPTVSVPLPTGVATFALNADRTIAYTFTTQDLTGPALLAHIHEGAPGIPGGIVVTLNQTTGTGTTAALSPAQVDTLRAGNLYINVHTGTNTSGEIRGQITALTAPSGTATFEFDPETGTLDYAVTAQNLSGPVLFAHLHAGQPGVAGPVAVTLDNSLTGSLSSLTEQQVNDLYDGNLYVNVHTTLNGGGEIRGQVAISGESECHCAEGTRKTFLRCIADRIRALKSDRKLASVKAIKRAAKLSSCGRTRASRKAIACCLPQTPTENILLGRVCAPVPERACTKKKGASLGTGSSCFPDNPCTPPASPSGAFLDGAPDDAF